VFSEFSIGTLLIKQPANPFKQLVVLNSSYNPHSPFVPFVSRVGLNTTAQDAASRSRTSDACISFFI